MSNDDDTRGQNDSPELMVIPAPTESTAVDVSAHFEDPTSGTPEQLGFHLRFEGGRALLALENVVVAAGIEIKRALFEVPDVEFPLDVTGGALKFQKSRLTLRAIELALKYDRMLQAVQLNAHGLELIRERTRSGTIELLVSVAGAAEPVPIRAQGLFVPVGDAGVAIVLHEVVPFGPSPRPRAQLAEMILRALDLPGGHEPHGMVRRAEPFKTTLSRLLPAFGWKVPAMGAVRVEEVVLKKSDVTFRAWSGDIPDGWKRPKKLRRAPIKDAVALAVFADELAKCANDVERIAVVDRLVDAGAIPAAVVPFAAEVLRTDPRRRSEGNALVESALQTHPDHLGVLSAHVDDQQVDDATLAARLATLGEAADLRDESWVSARSYLAAARRYIEADEREQARIAAEAGFAADPTLAPVGRLLSTLLRVKDPARALSVGRSALDRTASVEETEAFATELAPLARAVEGASAARALLERALRKRDRADTLGALITLEIEEGQLTRAAELLARLLLASEGNEPSAEERADVQLLAARLARAQGDDESARMHLASAQGLLPSHVGIAIQLAELHRDRDELDAAIEVLAPHADEDTADARALQLAAEMRVARAGSHDADKALGFLDRIVDEERTPRFGRVHAEAKALVGEPGPLAQLLRADAERTHDVSEQSAALSRAAHLFAKSGDVVEATTSVVALLKTGADDAAASAATAILAAEDATAVIVSVAVAEGVAVSHRDAIAAAMADADRPLDALAMIRELSDDAHLVTRSDLARAGGDVRAEIDATAALVVDKDGGLAAAAWERLGALHIGPDGDGPAAASDAFAHAVDFGGNNTDDWLSAAIAAEDNDRLVRVVSRVDVDLARVPTEALRTAAQTLVSTVNSASDDDESNANVNEANALAARRALAEVASRKESADDIDQHLAFAQATLEPRIAADVFAKYADDHQRPDWAMAAAALEEDAGAPGAALARLLEAAEGPLGSDVGLTERAFEMACERGHQAGIERATELLVVHLQSPADQAVVFGLAADALQTIDKTAWEAMVERRLDVDPGAEVSLLPLAKVWMERGEIQHAVERFSAFVEVNVASEQVVDALADIAVVAQEGADVDTETKARQLLSDARDDTDDRKAADLLRLAALLRDQDQFEDAVVALQRRTSLDGASDELAATFVQLAELCHATLGRPSDAADALTQALIHAPDDVAISESLLSILTELGQHVDVASEIGRRLGRDIEPATRAALRLRQGDAFDAATQPRDAERVWLAALRTPPFQKAALDRLEGRIDNEMSHRLEVRRHLAAAKALGSDPRSAHYSAEAGSILAGVLGKNVLALSAYRHAEEHGEEAVQVSSLQAQLEIFRAEKMADDALSAIARLVDRVDAPARAQLLESKAEVLEVSEGDAEAAAQARREALQLNPGLRSSALKLERSLREAGEFAEAIAVRKSLADQASTDGERAQTYADLAEDAIEHLSDDALAIELGEEALKGAPNLNRLRLMLVDALVRESRESAACDHLGWLLTEGSLDEGDRVTLARRKAGLEENVLNEPQSARKTLRQELARSPTSDTIIRDLVHLEEEMGEVAAAADALRSILREKPDGTEVLGSRREILEWMGRLEEDADDLAAAQETLSEAAALGRLSQGAAIRWARLCESAGDFDNAVAALEMLTTSVEMASEEYVAALGRLALNAERASQPARALEAWKARSERIPNDIDALRAMERLAFELDEPELGRKASDSLLHQEAGAAEEQAARTKAVARDERDRLQDPAAACRLFAAAREIEDSEALRREAWECAELASDDAQVFSILDAMWDAGDAVGDEELTRRAETGLAINHDAPAILEDALNAADLAQGVDNRIEAILLALGERAPEDIARAFLNAQDGTAIADALRAALNDVSKLGPDLLRSLADAHPKDAEIVRGAALSDVGDDAGGRAADRLLVLAQATGAEEDMERAADVLLESGDFSAFLGRLEALTPTIAKSSNRRQDALTILRDHEAWESVVSVLNASLAHQNDDDERAIRMELVAVLRQGVEDDERAAEHLEVLVERDGDDREAWGELIEAYESLDDQARLAGALGRRVDRTVGLERRELVRRRLTILLTAGEGGAGLEQLQSTRTEFPADHELKDLERQVHAAVGADALAEFHGAELRKGGGLADAEALLGLGDIVPLETRVLARAEVLRDDASATRAAATALVSRPEEFARVVALIDADAATRLFDAAIDAQVFDAHGAPNASTALALVAAIRNDGVTEPLRFTIAAAAWRLRAEGPAKARGDVQRIPDDKIRAAATIQLARRVSEPERIQSALSTAGASADAIAAFDSAMKARHPSASTIRSDAEAALLSSASPERVAFAAIRLEDAPTASAILSTLSADSKRLVAEKAQHLRVTRGRAEWMHDLASSLGTAERHALWRAVAAFGHATSQADIAADSLDALRAEGVLGATGSVRRAAIAEARNEPGAADALMFAAAIVESTGGRVSEGDDDTPAGMRRRAISRLVRSGDLAALGSALDAFVGDGTNAELVAEALQISRAARAVDVTDRLLTMRLDNTDAGDESDASKAMVRELVQHRQHAMRDPKAAFDILEAAIARYGDDATFVEDAYALAAREGLVEELVDVVGDPLARAGLLASLGRFGEAMDAAAVIDDRGARVLEADILYARGSLDEHRIALEVMAEDVGFGPGPRERLLDAAVERGAHDDTLRYALSLIATEGADDRLVDAVRVGAKDASDGAAERAAEELRAVLAQDVHANGTGDVTTLHLLDAWANCALRTGRDDDVIDARLSIAQQRNEDADWANWLDVALPRRDASAIIEHRDAILSRPNVVATALANDEQKMEAWLRAVSNSAPALVTDALVQLTDRDAAASAILIDSAMKADRVTLAADELLARGHRDFDSVVARHRAISLYLDGESVDAAERALLETDLDHYSSETAELSRRAIDNGADRGLDLVARLIASRLADDVDVDRGIALAKDAPVAHAKAFAALCLRRDRRDSRAIDLIATLGDSASVPFFRVQGALRNRELAALSEHDKDQLAPDFDVVHRLRAPAPYSPVAPAATSVLDRARVGRVDDRQTAWKALAEDAATADDAVLSARLLGRSGVPLHDAPIEIRLIADSSLNDKVRRADALATALAALSPDAAGDIERASKLVPQFQLLDAEGFTRAADRISFRGAMARLSIESNVDEDSLAPMLDAIEAGEGATWSEILRTLGRWPVHSARSTAAALAAQWGQSALAIALDPGIQTQAAAAPEAAIDFVARAGEARLRSRPLEALGLVRMEIARVGSDTALERQVRELANAVNRFDLVSESFGREAASVGDPALSAELLLERAHIHAERMHDANGAMIIARHAAEMVPGTPGPARLWADLALEQSADQERIDALVFVEMTLEDPAESRACVVERVQLLREAVGDAAAALRAAEAGEREYGKDPAILEERGRCHLALGDLAKAGHAFVAGSSLGGENNRRLELLREGALLLIGGDDLESGLDALIMGARANDREALDLLEDRARENDAGEALAEALRLRLAQTEDVPARRLIAMELAKHLADPLLRVGEARQILEQQAVEDDRDFNARAVLAQWYLDDRRTLDAALAYESAASVPDIDDMARGPAAQNAAVLLSALGDLERAGPLSEIAIACGAVTDQSLAVAIAFHRSHQNLAEIDALLGKQLELSDGALSASYIWMERAQIRAQQDDSDGARVALSRVLENRPDHLEALDGLRVDAHERDNFGPLRAALSRAADLGDDRERRVTWLLEIAHLDAEKFDDLRAGLATIDRAIELAPEDAQVLLTKADFMVRGGDVEGLPTLLDAATKLGAASIPGHLELKRGDALLITGDRSAAMDAFKRASASADVASAAWDRVIDLAEGLGDEDQLVEALAGAREAADDPERAVLFGRKEARARTKMNDDDAAATAWQVVINIAPGDTEALRALRDHFARKRKLDQFEPLIERWANAPIDPSERARRLSELGAFMLDELGAEAKAKDAFEAALELEPREQSALIRLAQVGYAAQDWDRAAELLDLIEANQWPRGPVAFAFAQAECAAQRGASDADTRLQVVLQQEPKHIPALELIAKRAQSDGRVDDAEQALEVLANVVNASEDPVRVANVCADLAILRLEQGRAEDAKTAAERALELHPTSRRMLAVAADAREAATDLAGAAQLLGSLAAVTEEGPDRIALVARRAALLRDAGMTHEAAEIFAYLSEATEDKDHRKQAIDLAMDLGDIILLERLGIDARPGDTNPGFHVLGQKAQSLLDEGRPVEALEVLEEAFHEGQGDAELARVGVLASEASGTAAQQAFFLSQRLPHINDPKEKQDVALAAGRLLRDELDDPEKAAEMLYVAHQCAPENLELRLELTSLYARLPRLIAHAQTGVLQLIRRAPSDPRAFQVATNVALAQGRADKKGAMIAASLLLDGRPLTPEVAPPGPLLPSADVPLLQSATTSILAPKAFAKGRTFGTLVALLGGSLEGEFIDNRAKMATADRLLEVRPDAERYLERIDRLMPGRPVKFLVSDVDLLTFHPGAVLHAILPRHVLRFGDAVLVAFVARAYAVARLGGVIPETLDPDDMGEVRRLLEAAFLDVSPDEGTRRKADRLLSRIPEDLKGAASNGAKVALPSSPAGEAKAFGEGIRIIADRFALLVSGSLPGTLAAGGLPEVLVASPSATSAALVSSPRALDLCRFAARDDVWDLRREHALIID